MTHLDVNRPRGLSSHTAIRPVCKESIEEMDNLRCPCCLSFFIFFIPAALSPLNSITCIFFPPRCETAVSLPAQQHLICSLISISTLSASPDGAACRAGQQWHRAKGTRGLGWPRSRHRWSSRVATCECACAPAQMCVLAAPAPP